MANEPPGSREAVEKGCTCDPDLNRDGVGYRTTRGDPLFFIEDDCPLRGHKEDRRYRPPQRH
jgi:hypothetical protein